MSRIKQVLRCYVAGKGTRSISDLLDISRNTVKKYITIFNTQEGLQHLHVEGLPMHLIEEMKEDGQINLTNKWMD